jgi:hypothetical protein
VILKKRYLFLVAIVFSSLLVLPSNAQTVTKNLTLQNFDVTLTFPMTANPGDSILVSVNAVARSYVTIKDLSVQVLAYVESGDLQSIASASLASDKSVNKGGAFNKDVSATVPTTILRGELVAVVSETVSSTNYYNYGYYPYYYGYSYPYYTDPSTYTYYWYYPYYYTYYYPSYNQQYVESKVLPCTYILATTPEYVKLKSDYDNLSTKYSQATDQNKQLTDQLNATIQEANNSKMLSYAFIAATVVLAVLAVAFMLLYTAQKKVERTTYVSSPTSQSEVTDTRQKRARKTAPASSSTPQSEVTNTTTTTKE